MTKFHFVTYGVIHAENKNEAKCFLQEAVKDGQFEYFDVIVEDLDT